VGTFDLGHGQPLLGAIRCRAVDILDFTRMATSTLPAQAVEDKSVPSASELFDRYFSRITAGTPASWNLKTLGGLLALVVIWAAWLHGTWGAWGNLSVDSGREMYVASALAEGKVLYQDVWFNFGPASPYFNGWLFRLFGVHLSVLYWAGSLSALASAILLYLCGMRLSSATAGWTAGAVLLFESFHPTLFSFPLPYSFAAVYGCVIACCLLWLAIGGVNSRSWVWVCVAGIAAAIALLLKFEFGGACYITLALLILARACRQRSWKAFLTDLAATIPGLVVCGLAIRWMVHIQGVTFLTKENFQSWPGSYFLRTYGKTWLALTGFDLSGAALAAASQRIFIFLATVQGLHLILTASGQRLARRIIFLRAALFLLAVVYLVWTMNWYLQLRSVFFPQDMVVYVGIAALAAWIYFWRHRESGNAAASALLLTLSALIAFRILFKMLPNDYAIFYNGPAVLSFLLLMRAVIPRSGRSTRFILVAETVLCLACLAVPVARSRDAIGELPRPAWLNTQRGSIRLSLQGVEQYQAAIQFMKEKAALGESVLSVPEDTSLYFLSETHCPVRVIAFTPGMIAPGKMTEETIQQIERNNVRYLIWSNRLFPEYGVLRFGTDFDQTLGAYLFAHYHRVGPLSAAPARLGEWNAYIWERIPQSNSRKAESSSKP